MRAEFTFPGHKPFDVVGLGRNAVDHICVVPHYPRYDSKLKMTGFTKQGGGQTATAMVTCARLGLKVSYIGSFGSDDLGAFSRESLLSEGIDISASQVIPGAKNQFAFILVTEDTGERTIIWDRDPKLRIDPNGLDRKAVCSGKILHLDGYDVEAAIRAASWAKDEGIIVCLDGEKIKEGNKTLLGLVDVLIGDQLFAERITGIKEHIKAMKKLQAFGPEIVGMTLGRQGALILYKEHVISSKGYKIETVDTTGAGDVFHGAFIYGLLSGWSIDTIASFSNGVAAMKCRHLGGRRGIPRLEEVEKFTKGAHFKEIFVRATVR